MPARDRSERSTRWIVMHDDHSFVGASRFSYKAGTTLRGTSEFKFARLFTRESDAKQIATGTDKVYPVEVILWR